MNNRKQQVVNKAHQLFIEKGFQATSIQDIIDYSGISKGTFYNYFSSKNELLMAIFTSLNHQISDQRNKLLIGQDPADIEILIQQLELQMAFNQRNKLLTLFEEVFVSNDPALKQFLKQYQIRHIRWTYLRFVDIFGKSKQPYLLDVAIMFTGMLHHNIHFHFLANGLEGNMKQVIRYTVQSLVKIVDEIDQNPAPLLNPDVLEKWLPDGQKPEYAFRKELNTAISALKNFLSDGEDQLKQLELLDFIEEELLHSKMPRKYLIQSALASLNENTETDWLDGLQKLERKIEDYFAKLDKIRRVPKLTGTH